MLPFSSTIVMYIEKDQKIKNKTGQRPWNEVERI